MPASFSFRISSFITTLFVLVTVAESISAQAQEMKLAPSKALSCLARIDGKGDKLEYPQDALERRDGGTVDVEMTFKGPDRAPHVKIKSQATTSEIDDAVSDYAEGFRMPCMDPKGDPVTLRQQYVFVPNDGRKVVSTTARDEGDVERKTLLACIKNVAGEERPEYPMIARTDGSQGRFYLDLSFSAPDKAPELQWLVSAKSKVLRGSLEDYLKNLRMPCQHGEPVHTRILFIYVLSDSDRTFVRDMTLRDFVGAAAEVPRPVYFDMNKMGCPFDLRIAYMQPHEKNIVEELETANPARRAFMDWLSNLKLRMTDDQLSKVIGTSFTVSVPCGSVDL